MQKGASKKQNYLKRVANSSLRPKKTGDNSDLAEHHISLDYTLENGRDRVREAKLISADIDAVKLELSISREQKAEINVQLTQTLPFESYARLNQKSRELGLEQQRLQNRLMQLKAELRQLDVPKIDSFERAFISTAEQVLPADVFNQILQTTREYFASRGIKYI